MTEQQLLVYGARIRLGWFRKADQLGSVSAACKYYGIARSVYYYWHERWLKSGKQITSLYDLPRTPKSHPKDADEATISLVFQLRWGKRYGEDALAYVLGRDYGVAISGHGVGNILKRAGELEKRKKKVRTSRQLSDRQYYPGEVGQMDVKHWKRKGYQYDLIDCATRIKYKRIYPGWDPQTTVDFLERATRFFAPAFCFAGIQTDNGTEFSYDHLPQVKPATKAAPELWLENHAIEHLRIPNASPHLNGRIERPHGVDKYRYKRLTTNSHEFRELREFAIEDCLDYNFYRPHSSLRMMTPIEYLQSLDGFAHATVNTSVLDV
ncbi:MAG: integrase core domain-containing protein [Acidobacteriota bacterium]